MPQNSHGPLTVGDWLPRIVEDAPRTETSSKHRCQVGDQLMSLVNAASRYRRQRELDAHAVGI